eukprot:12399763-Karenia_brevis.AAC.1
MEDVGFTSCVSRGDPCVCPKRHRESTHATMDRCPRCDNGRIRHACLCPATETPRKQKLQDTRRAGAEYAKAAELPPRRAPIGV